MPISIDKKHRLQVAEGFTFVALLLAPFQNFADQRWGVAPSINISQKDAGKRRQLEGLDLVVPRWVGGRQDRK